MKGLISAAIAFGLTVSASAAYGQDKQTPPPKGQPGKASVNYQGGIQQNPWFMNQDVRGQLKFNEQQFNQLNKAYQQNWMRYDQGMNQLPKDISDDQRRQRSTELQQSFYKEFGSASNETFTDKAQRERYNQLSLQYRGVNAFQDPTIQERLNLTAEQRLKLNEQGTDWSKQMMEMGQKFGTDQPGTTKRFNEMRTTFDGRINEILTPEQRKNWTEMRGESYAFPPSVYFQSSTGTEKK